jgi:hypothetical protein
MTLPPIAVFAYSFPHQKTHDFLLEMAAEGFRNVSVIGAPWRDVASSKSGIRIGGGIKNVAPKSARDISASLGYTFIEVPHEDVDSIIEIKRRKGFEIGIISGARIIKPGVISLFNNGIINIHPGKLPETSGLDSFFYSILQSQPIGVTAHLIDERVDAGLQLFFEETEIGPDDSVEMVVRNNYVSQVTAMRRVLSMIKSGDLAGEVINRPKKNPPLDDSLKREALSRYPFWRAMRVRDQLINRLFQACERGDVSVITRILSAAPSFVGARSERGWTPLIVAAFNHNMTAVQTLLGFGADVNAMGNNGTTVFMYAKTRLLNQPGADYGLLQLLLDSGADLSRTDCRGLSVIDYVRQAGDQQMLQWIESKSQHVGV